MPEMNKLGSIPGLFIKEMKNEEENRVVLLFYSNGVLYNKLSTTVGSVTCCVQKERGVSF